MIFFFWKGIVKLNIIYKFVVSKFIPSFRSHFNDQIAFSLLIRDSRTSRELHKDSIENYLGFLSRSYILST